MPLRTFSYAIAFSILTVPAAAQTQPCSVLAGTSPLDRPATREQTLREVTALHDCLMGEPAEPARELSTPLAFWPWLLDGILVLLCLAAVAWVGFGKTISRRWVGIAAACVLLLLLGRTLLAAALSTQQQETRSKQVAAAELKWQLAMVRARQSADPSAAEQAIRATEQFAATMQRR